MSAIHLRGMNGSPIARVYNRSHVPPSATRDPDKDALGDHATSIRALNSIRNYFSRTQQRLIHVNTAPNCEQYPLIDFVLPLNPVTRERYEPYEWQAVREQTVFKFPCCYCSVDPLIGNGKYVESAVFKVAANGKSGLAGKWVAACASRKCNFFMYIHRRFENDTAPFRVYPDRHVDTPAPPMDIRAQELTAHASTNPFAIESLPFTDSPATGLLASPSPSALDSSPSFGSREMHASSSASGSGTRINSLKRTHSSISDAAAGPSTPSKVAIGKRRKTDHNVYTIGHMHLRALPPTPDQIQPSVVTQLLRLNDTGLTMRDFRELVVTCDRCHSWVGTQTAFAKHTCVVIDLTGESDSNKDSKDSDE